MLRGREMTRRYLPTASTPAHQAFFIESTFSLAGV
jgi:hypothetical protein